MKHIKRRSLKKENNKMLLQMQKKKQKIQTGTGSDEDCSAKQNGYDDFSCNDLINSYEQKKN